MPERVSVTSAEFIRNIGFWQNEALRRPVSITHHGRERLVLTTPDTSQGAAIDGSLTRLRADADAIVENLEDGFLMFDAELRLARCNGAAAALIGRSRDVLRGQAMPELMPPPLGLLLEARLQRVLRARKPEDCTGVLGAVQVSARIFPVSEGVAVLLKNVTEHADDRMRLGVGDALCAATNHHPHVAGIKLDAAGRVIAAHSGFHVWSGFEAEEIVGKRLIDLVPTGQRRQVATALDGVLRDGAAQRTELVLIDRDGQEVSGVLSLAPIQIDLSTQGAMAVWVRHMTVDVASVDRPPAQRAAKKNPGLRDPSRAI